MDDEEFKEISRTFFNPEIQSCIRAVESITGFKLSASDRQPFLYFHDFLTNPEPHFISKWRADCKQERWYHKFTNGFLTDVQNSFCCVLYHHGRLKAVEAQVMEAVEKIAYRNALRNNTFALGNNLIWDFEYQAFILAFRRCLDYFARALCSYFKSEFHSFRKLSEALSKFEPDSVARSLISMHEKYASKFEFVLSDGTKKSIRDKISHFEYVPAGVINLSRRGFILAGGGEQLSGIGSVGRLFSEAIDGHLANLRSCIREMIYRFVDEIRSLEKRDTGR